MSDERPPATGSVRPTVLVVGDDEPMDEALCAALDRNGLDVERVPTLEAVDATRLAAPDLVLLVGDAARAAGEAVLARLAQNPLTQVVPVALLSDDAALGQRLAAFRHGAVAVVPRTASVDEMARKVADVAREMPERRGEQTGELGEATFDELMKLVKQELRSGILSVEAGGTANTEGSSAFRLVLGAGKPVAKAVEAFVAQLRPLVSKAEPLRYELLEHAGARFGLLDSETGGAGESEADLAALRGLRVLLVVLDPVRADALSSELRARGATVAVADASGRGLDRARGLDPEVVIIDAAGIEGPGFAVVKACRRDPRLRWASMLVAQWEELWPDGAGSPDMLRLASRLAPLIEPDRSTAERARTEPSFDTRLELIGPSRLLRALARVEPTLHVTVRNPRCVVDVDLSQGLVVGAIAKPEGGAQLEGHAALAALLALGSGRVRIERRTNPQSANVMAPVEEALAVAAGEESPLVASMPPPSLVGGLGAADSSAPPATGDSGAFFPASAPVEDEDGSGPLRPQQLHAAMRTAAPATPAAARDLSWADSAPSLLAPNPAASPLVQGARVAQEAPPAVSAASSASAATPPSTSNAAAPPRAISNAFDEAPTSTHAPLGQGKRTLVGLPSPNVRGAPVGKAVPPPKSPARPKTMLGLAPALSATPAVASPAASPAAPVASPMEPAASAVPGFVPASSPPVVAGFVPASSPPAVDSEPPAPEPHLPPPARLPKEAAAAAAASPAQTIAPAARAGAPAAKRAPTMMGMPPLAASHLAPELTSSSSPLQPGTAAPTMNSTLPGAPTPSIPPAPAEPLASVVMLQFGEPAAPPAPLAADSFVIPEASVILSAPPATAAVPAPRRRSLAPLFVVAAIAVVFLGVAAVAAALILPRLLSASTNVADARPPIAQPPIARPPIAQPPIAQPPIARPPVVQPPIAQPPIAQPDASAVAVTAPPPDAPPTTLVDAGTVALVAPPPDAPPPIAQPSVAPPPIAPPPIAPESPIAVVEDDAPSPDDEVSAGDRLVVRANRVLSAGDMRQAEVIYLQALEAEPRNPHALAGLARLHLARRAGRQALAYAEQAVAVRPRRAAYRVVQGDALALLGRRADATRAYREALRIDPRNREARARVATR